MLKRFHNAGDLPAVTFWRSSDGLEVDFVIEAAGKLHAIETKANATPMPRMADGLLAWRRLQGRRAGCTALACDCREKQPLAPSVEAIPWRQVGDLCAEILG